jgi:AcrR family transcriptional regulator
LNKKEKDILKAGKDLFWRYGIKRVTVEEVCQTAGASKMTFYKYFRNKNDLVKGILNMVFDDAFKKFKNILKADIAYKDKARQMIKLKLEGTMDISKEFMSDYFNLGDADLIAFLHKRTNEVIDIFTMSLREAQQKGEVRSDINPGFIMYFFNQVQVMAADPELLKLYPSAQDLVMELINFFFYGIIEDGNK